MLTAEEYAALTGNPAPESFDELALLAEEILHARTLQQYRNSDISEAPLAIFKRALALQVAYMDSRGAEGWADPAMMASGVTLGRFSVHGSGGASSAQREVQLLAPGAAVLLPTLMAYARAWMGGDAP